jgi:hypothetical protein
MAGVSLQIELLNDRYTAAVITVVIAAHNHGHSIGPLLRGLIAPDSDDDVTVIVVASGCADNTVRIASSFGAKVRVFDLPWTSKHRALMAGDAAAAGYPRVYVDADVIVGAGDLRALARELARPGVLAAVPERVLALDGCARAVRWYFDIWQRLPQVRRGMFGRGVLGVSEAGHQRLLGAPAIVAGDLGGSLAFAHAERRVVAGARGVSPVPRTLAGLLRYRRCVASEVFAAGDPGGGLAAAAGLRPAGLFAIACTHPDAVPAAALFLLVTALAWAGARWQRNSGTPGWGCLPAG